MKALITLGLEFFEKRLYNWMFNLNKREMVEKIASLRDKPSVRWAALLLLAFAKKSFSYRNP